MRQGEILGLTWPMVDFDYQLMDISCNSRRSTTSMDVSATATAGNVGGASAETAPRAPCEFRMAISTAGSTARYACANP